MNDQQRRARKRGASGFSMHCATRSRRQRLEFALEGLESRVLLDAAPVITAPVIFGVRPGSLFLFDVTASGDRPMTFSAVGLPAGLTLDSQTGMITGSLASAATYDLTVVATNPTGSAQQKLRIVVGDKISLTPAMGWNSWTVDQGKPTDAEVRAQAAAIASSGLINYGWTYVNVDGGWEGGRTAEGAPLQGNATTFPDMQGLSDYIHSLNLKFGVYTVPQWFGYANEPAGTSGVNIWPDARQFGTWGVDYLKYDGGPVSPSDIMQMNQALQASGRDIIFSMSYFGGLQATPGNVAFYTQWANSWRVGSDITDFYSLVLTDGISLEQPWATFSGPGRWNDPDSLMVGDVVGTGGTLHSTGMTLNQQQSAMSIWSMAAAPLLLGSDLSQLSSATMAILTNPEVIAIDQDPLGIQSLPVNGRTDIQSRPLADGSLAVELINYYDTPQTMTVNFADLGLSGPQVIRDLWAKQNVATSGTSYTVTVPVGATALIKLTAATPGAPQITFEPVNQQVNAGSSATFSIAATGTGTLSYQWTKNGAVIPGANSATYATPASTASDDGAMYRCIVTNNVGRVISYEADLSVHGITSYLSDGFYYNGISSYVNNTIRFDASVEGFALNINGTSFNKGIGTQADSAIDFWLDRNYATFDTTIGLDSNKSGSVEFQIWLDGVKAYSSGPVTASTPAIPISLNVMGASTLKLVVVNTGDSPVNGQADWGDAHLTTALVSTSLPLVLDIAKSTPFNTPMNFGSVDFLSAFNDPNAGQSLQNIQIASLPTHGTLKLNGAAVALSQIIPVTQIATLTYTPAGGYSGSDTFAWNGTDLIGYAVTAAAVNLAVLAPPPPSIPSAPIGFTATPGNGQVVLNWTAIAGAASYTIRYGTLSGSYSTTLNAAAGTTRTISGLVNGTPYYFVVSAVNASGESPTSAEAAAIPAAPVAPPAASLDFSGGFASAASALAINGSASISAGKILLTNNTPSQVSSVYAKTQQNVTAFTTAFDFQIDGTWPLADGFTFVIQRTGLSAIGMGGGGLGYGAVLPATTGGISNSVAIKFDVFDNQGEGSNSTGFYANGVAPTSAGAINLDSTGFNMRSYDPSNATITYDGTTLTVVLTDLRTHAVATQTYHVDIPALIGGSTAWVGFTAADGSIFANQVISKWTFSSAPSAPLAPAAAPNGLAATPGIGQALLNWTAVPGADSYTIKYGTTSGSYSATLPGLTATSKTITGLTPGISYYFVVAAVNGAGESLNSNEATITPIAPAPAAPTGLTATPGNAQVALTWNAIAGATGYTIKYGTTTGSYSTSIAGLSTTAATVPSLNNGTLYFFVVTATGPGGESVNSIETSAAPAAPVIPVAPNAPAALSATPGNGEVTLTWSSVSGAARYTIKYGTSSGSYTQSLSAGAATSITIPALSNGTSYYFVVAAVNDVGESANSPQASAIPALPIPAVPTGLAAVAGDGQAVLTWTAAAGAATYTIRYGTTDGGPYGSTLSGITATTVTIPGISNGVRYYFVVTAVNGGGASPNSTQTSALPAAASAPSAGLDFTNGFAGAASSFAFNGPAKISGSDLELTDGSQSKAVSVFNTTQQNIAGFSTQFDFQLTGTWPLGDGFTFVIQRAGLNALGVGGGGLGYGADHTGGTGGIANSIAIKFDLYDNQGEGNNSTGLYVNGEAPTLPHAVWLGNTAFNMLSYNRSRAAITYDGTTLTVVLTDLVTNATVTQHYTIDIPATIGGNLAWVGFTAGTGHMTNVGHILNWNFASTAAAPPPAVPSAPAPPTATPGNGQVALTWNAVQGATTYNIKYAAVSGGPYIVLTPISGTSKTLSGLTNGAPYYFVVSAVNAVGESANSNEATVTPAAPVLPAAPTNLTATPGNAQVVLTWKPVAGAASYTVKYATTSGGPYTLITGVSGTTQTLSGLTNGTPYYFVVSATNPGGEGNNSSQANATPLVPAPAAPAGVGATAGHQRIDLNWNPVAGATSYTIKYGTTSGGSYSNVITGLTATTASFINLTNGTPYYFIVLAVNGAGESPASAQTAATPNSVTTTIDFSNGFAGAGSALKINGSAYLDAGRLLMTTNQTSQVSSIYSTTQQKISTFNTEFDFQITGSWPLGDGFTFVIQRAGITALGQSGAGLGYGIADTGPGISNSMAIKFDVYSNQGEGTNSTGLYVNGAAPTSTNAVDLTGTGFDLRSYNRSHASITYDGTILTVVLTDLVTHAAAVQKYTVNIPALIGGNTAWVGFTAADGSIVSNQTILTWTYTA